MQALCTPQEQGKTANTGGSRKKVSLRRLSQLRAPNKNSPPSLVPNDQRHLGNATPQATTYWPLEPLPLAALPFVQPDRVRSWRYNDANHGQTVHSSFWILALLQPKRPPASSPTLYTYTYRVGLLNLLKSDPCATLDHYFLPVGDPTLVRLPTLLTDATLTPWLTSTVSGTITLLFRRLIRSFPF